MARVVLPSSVGRQYTGGTTEIEVEGGTVREVVRALEALYPGLGALIEAAMAIAVDGEILQDPYLEPVRSDSELFVLPKLGGG
jgi:molybdopterin converting factor small subunit